MPEYKAPLRDMRFLIDNVFDFHGHYAALGATDASPDMVSAILEEGAKFCENVLAPLNRSGDEEGCHFDNGVVTTPKGFKQAFAQYVEGGWHGVAADPAYGGQGLPHSLGLVLSEMIGSSNTSWGMYPGLTHGAMSAIHAHGTDEQKATYLSKLTAGEWTGTMCLTEAHCGTDLGLIKTRAVPQADGSYAVTGSKIFISAGEHDMSANIIHLVLAKLPDAPAGTKGISLFIVPKFHADSGERNAVHCGSIEHKMGIKASPTAVLQYGDHGGAVGYLVGQENRGLEYMFIMMNAARYAVGVQGIAIAERAYQKAVGYAKDRVQSRPVDGSLSAATPIIHHPDVKRMLMTMRASTEGCRAMASVAAAAYDAAHHHPDADARKDNAAFYEYLVPLVKGYSTEMSLEVTSLGVQVHGGMGFIEETGAAQYYRDAKILTIYEGTTAIQANDLVGRKTSRDGGTNAKAIAAQIEKTEAELIARGSANALAVAKRLTAARQAFVDVVAFIAANARSNPNAAFAGSVPYLMLAGNVVAGWQLARALLVAEDQLAAGTDVAFMQAKINTARFYADHILSRAPGVRDSICEGADAVTAMAVDAF